jgi:CarD family transcriptional regulator
MSALKFKIGDKVVYPNHGVGIVKEIRELSYGGEEHTCLSLQILQSDSVVMVPIENSKSVGLRRLMPKSRVQQVLDRLQDAEAEAPNDWKGRYQENQAKMLSGDIEEVAEVLKALTYLSTVKTLSYRERKMLERARTLVVSELAEASRQDATAIEQQVDEAMGIVPSRIIDH